jgi:hypothetical protein
VRLVSRTKAEPRLTYVEWIRSIAASGNRGAIRVKLADNKHNSDPARAAQLPPNERTSTLLHCRPGQRQDT